LSQADFPDPPRPPVLARVRRQFLVEAAYLGSFFKRWSIRGFFIILHAALVLGGFYGLVWWVAHGACYANIDRVPVRLVGLVLGCVKKVGPYDNEFFKNRVDAAARLYQAGKVQYLIVTGDNSRNGYDEPTDLKAALIEKGVPANHIYCDYAGFRTLDSIVRAKKVFGQDDCTIVSQRFHNERALYLARRSGMPDAVAFDAENPISSSTAKMHLRELLARCKAVLDVEFLHTEPKFLGKHISIGPKDPPVDAQPMSGGKLE
jgi:SanA protein